MNKLIYKLKKWWKLKTEKCDGCHHRLRKNYDSCFGAVDVPKNISGTAKETFYLCNLCYYYFKK